MDLKRVWGIKKKISKVSWVLAATVLDELRSCQDCKDNPAVFLTAKKVPCCRLCLEKLSDNMSVAGIELQATKVDQSSEDKEAMQ